MVNRKTFNIFRKQLRVTPSKKGKFVLSRTFWKGNFYYRQSDKRWIDRDTGVAYRRLMKTKKGYVGLR